MTKIKHLEKITEIIDDIKVCMMVTKNDKGELRSRPMHTIKQDDHHNLWFFTESESAKVYEIYNQQPIALTYADPSQNTYLSLSGLVQTVDDLKLKREMFDLFAKAWFPEGYDSDKLTMIQFIPTKAEYWDSSDNPFVQSYKMGKAIITGERVEYEEDAHATVEI